MSTRPSNSATADGVRWVLKAFAQRPGIRSESSGLRRKAAVPLTTPDGPAAFTADWAILIAELEKVMTAQNAEPKRALALGGPIDAVVRISHERKTMASENKAMV
ncbi:hypothetical protein ACH40F_56650 [Streptomyces sp. NPDC020794]|uniref:hypothetical protein n=1 Tax=unclassified Streptomyces TaxID=2593676 RepID=UPI0036E4C80E